jgi:DNA-binding response OmpR family regulator
LIEIKDAMAGSWTDGAICLNAPPMRILIVEDEYLLVGQMEHLAEAAGHAVTGTAASAALARELCRSELPDLAMIDLHLRDGLTGLALAEELWRKGVTVWFITANSKECLTHRHYALGCVPKPFMDRHLLKAMELSRLHREGHPPPAEDPEGIILYRRAPAAGAGAPASA